MKRTVLHSQSDADERARLLALLPLLREDAAEERLAQRYLRGLPCEARVHLGLLVLATVEEHVAGTLTLRAEAPDLHQAGVFARFSPDDVVEVLGEGRLAAHVVRTEPQRIVLDLRADSPHLPVGEPVSLCWLGSVVGRRREQKAIERAASDDWHFRRLRQRCSGWAPARRGSYPAPLRTRLPLNPDQSSALRTALASRNLFCLHGPPRSGKTRVLAALAAQATAEGRSVLAVAPTVQGADRLAEALSAAGVSWLGPRVPGPQRKLERLRARQALRGATPPRGVAICASLSDLDPQRAAAQFDLLIIDEAAQATEPLAWVGLGFGRQVALAGSPMHLIPRVFSVEASAAGLSVTLFDRLRALLDPACQTELRTQYDVAPAAGQFCSKRFYEDRVLSASADRGGLEVIDVQGEHEVDSELLSLRNRAEAGAVSRTARALVDTGLDASQIVVLTPFVAQALDLRRRLAGLGVEVASTENYDLVRRRAVVLVSLVVSYPPGEEDAPLGFVSDQRRMHLALTLAQERAIVVGDFATLRRDTFFADLARSGKAQPYQPCAVSSTELQVVASAGA